MMRFLVGVLALLVVIPAMGQSSFPNQPITLIVPYAPGGAADIVARPLATALTRELKQPVLVVNQAGASGAIGTRAVATSRPDGYTLLVGAVQMSILPEVDRLFGKAPAYQVDDFVGIARLTADPVVFLVAPNSPLKTMRDVLEKAKQQPGKLTYSSGGVYSGIHLPFEVFAQQAGIQMLHVPYKGGGPSMTAMLGGEVDMTAQVPGVAYQHVAAGKVVAIAHSGATRLQDFPTVPSLKDLGYDVEFYLWVGLFAPRGVPADVMSQLQGAAARAMKSREIENFASATRTRLGFQDSSAFNAWWKVDAEALTRTVGKIGKVQ